MAIQCPKCRRQYDVTLFQFRRTVQCECGERLDLRQGHIARAGAPEAESEAMVTDPITPPTREYIESAQIAYEYDEYFRFNELFRYDKTVLGGWFAEPGRLLDLGCGTGRHLVYFAAKGFEVTGVDLSDHMLTASRRALAARGVGGTLVQGDLMRLSELGLGRFDYAICMFSTLGMIYGRANRLAFLRAVRGLLEPDGRLALHVHNRWHNLWYAEGRRYLREACADWLKRRPEPFQKIVDGYRGIRRMSLYVYSDREIRRDLASAGFRVTEMLYLNVRRNGALRGPFRGLRANGFIVCCQPS